VDVLQVIYYTNDAGRPIVKDWIDNLEAGAQAKIYRDIDLLERYGMAFAGEFVTISKADKKAGVYYLKINFGGCTYRIFFGVEGDAIILHGINKKSQDIPANDIKTAIKRFKNFVRKR